MTFKEIMDLVFLPGFLLVCVCVFVFSSLCTPTLYEFVYIIFLFLESSTFRLLLFLLEIMAKYRQAAKPLNVMINSEDPSKKDRKCLRPANGTRNISRIQSY